MDLKPQRGGERKRAQLSPERWQEGRLSPAAFLNGPSNVAIAPSLQHGPKDHSCKLWLNQVFRAHWALSLLEHSSCFLSL